MTSIDILGVPILDLPEIFSADSQDYLVIKNVNSSALAHRISLQNLLAPSQDYLWKASETYSTGEIKEYNLKWWKSKVDNNKGNVPAEGTYWTEVSKADGSGIRNWQAGVYTSNVTVVLKDSNLYELDQTIPRPYESTDFAAELAAGDWIDLGNALSQEQVQDYVAPMFNHGNHVGLTASYDDANNQMILEVVGTGDSLTQEEVQDFAALLLDHANHTGLTAVYDDANNRVDLTVVETDPVFVAHPSYNITQTDINNWNTSFNNQLTAENVQDFAAPLLNHGFHSGLTAAYDDANNVITLDIVESDPIFGASPAATITTADINNWDDAFGWGDHSLAGYVTENTQLTEEQVQDFVAPMFAHSSHSKISATYVDTGNILILNVTETDPVFSASPASNITLTQISEWDTAYGWGDHSLVGYVTENTQLTEEQVQDFAALLFNHSNHVNLTTTYDDANNQIILTSIQLTEEEVQDFAAPLLNHIGHSGITVGYDDVNNQLVLTVENQIDQEQVEDISAGLFTHGNHVGLTSNYDDANGQVILTVVGTGDSLSQEEVQDFSAALFTHVNHSGITVVYDDVNNEVDLTIVESDPVFLASPAGGITSQQVTNWDIAFGWGDHSVEGYLKSVDLSGDYWLTSGTTTLGNADINSGSSFVNFQTDGNFSTTGGYNLSLAPTSVSLGMYTGGSNRSAITVTDSSGSTLVQLSATDDSFNSRRISIYTNPQGSAKGMEVRDNSAQRGLEYFADYSANYTLRSLVDKEYVDGLINATLTQEEVQDFAAPLFNHGNHVGLTASYDDANNQMILTVVGTGDSLTQEEVQDFAAALFNHANHTNITATYDDVNNRIDLAFVDPGNHWNVLGDTSLSGSNTINVDSSLTFEKPSNSLISMGDRSAIMQVTDEDGSYSYVRFDDSFNGADFKIRVIDGGNIKGFSASARTDLGILITDQIANAGLYYAADYSANYTNRSLIDKGYADNAYIKKDGSDIQNVSGTLFRLQLAQGWNVYNSNVEHFININQQYMKVKSDTGNYFTQIGGDQFVSTHATAYIKASQNFGPEKRIYLSTQSGDDMLVEDEIDSKGLVYAADYSANFVDRSIPDWGAVKAYADGAAGGVSLSQEQVQDYAAPLLNHTFHNNVTAIYNDSNNRIELTAVVTFGGLTDNYIPVYDSTAGTLVDSGLRETSGTLSFVNSYGTRLFLESTNRLVLSDFQLAPNAEATITVANNAGTQIQFYEGETDGSLKTEFNIGNHGEIQGVLFRQRYYDGAVLETPTIQKIDYNQRFYFYGLNGPDGSQVSFENYSSGIGIGLSDGTNSWNIGTSSGNLYFDDGNNGGLVHILNVPNAASDTGKYLVLDSNGGIQYRTTSQVSADVGGGGSGFTQEEVEDIVGNMFTSNLNSNIGINVFYDDSNGEIYFEVTAGGGTALTQEEVQDYVAPMFDHANHTNITVLYDDANNRIELTAPNIQLTQEQVQDYIAPMFTHSNHTNTTVFYDDSANQLIITSTASGGTQLTQEEVQDFAAPLLNHANHTNITATYVDASNRVDLSIANETIYDLAGLMFNHSNHNGITATHDDANNQVILTGLGGSGTNNFVPLWDGTNSLDTSVIQQNSSNEIGIGTFPTEKLHVKGGNMRLDDGDFQLSNSDPFGVEIRHLQTGSKFNFRQDGNIETFINGVNTFNFNSNGIYAGGKAIYGGDAAGTGLRVGFSSSNYLGFFGATPVAKPSGLTAPLSFPSYVFGSVGFDTVQQFSDMMQTFRNTYDRVLELETKLQNLGLIT